MEAKNHHSRFDLNLRYLIHPEIDKADRCGWEFLKYFAHRKQKSRVLLIMYHPHFLRTPHLQTYSMMIKTAPGLEVQSYGQDLLVQVMFKRFESDSAKKDALRGGRGKLVINTIPFVLPLAPASITQNTIDLR